MSTTAFSDHCRQLGTVWFRNLIDSSSAEPAPVDYPFRWGDCWTGNIGVAVADLEAEIGFWVDVMGFRPFVFFDETLMFRSPDNTFGMSLSRATDEAPPSDSITVELMLENIEEAVERLRERGAEFDRMLHPVWGEENTMRTSELTSPAGFHIILWGIVQRQTDEIGHAEQPSETVQTV